MKKTSLKYVLSIFLLIVAVSIVLKTDSAEILTQISFPGLAIVVFVSFLVYASRGVMVGYLTAKRFDTRLGAVDMITLPVAMNFWSLIIPIRGGMLYQIFFLKMKYQIAAVKGMSITIYTYLLTMVITGIFGLYFSIAAGRAFSAGTLVSVVLILSPLNIVILNRVLKLFKFKSAVFLKNIKELVDLTVANSNSLLSDIRTTLAIIGFTLGTIFLRIVQYYCAARAFNMDVSVAAIVLLSLINTLVIVFSFTPSNIGVNELFSGGVFVVLGGTASQGILIGLLIQVSCLILTLSIGWWSTIKNMRYFDIDGMKSMWSALKKN